MNFFQCSVLIAILVPLAACMTTSTRPPGREVVTTVIIAAQPERVLQAFLDGDDLRGWWKVSRSLVKQEPGGTWAVTWDDYGEERSSHVWTGVIQEIGPRRLLIGDMVLVEPGRPLFAALQIEIIVEPADTGCALTVIHRGYRYGADWDWIHEIVIAGWQHVLGDLQAYFAAK